MNGRVSIVGSLNLDQVVRIDRWPDPGETVLGEFVGKFPGGKGFNQAVAAHRAGAAVTLCGAAGADASGAFLRKVMVDAGLDDAYLCTSQDQPTAIAQIAALPSGENSIVVIPGANLTIDVERATSAVQGAAVVLVQLEIHPGTVMAVLAAARQAGAQTILNAAPAQAATGEMLALVDLLVVNETELATLGGLDHVLAAGPRDVVVTLGAKGAYWISSAGERVTVPAFKIEPVDTTGAGDAFCGTLAASLAWGLSKHDAMERAAAAGAIVACAVGAQTETLSASAIERMIASRSAA